MSATVREMLIIFVITMILLAMFNSTSLVTWSYDIQVGFISDYVSFFAENWHEMMENLGLAQVTQALRDWFANTTDTI